MSANRKFQSAWNNFLKGFYKRKSNKNGAGLLMYVKRMHKQIDLAKDYGKIQLAILGDSNAENLASYQYMKKFDPIGVSINLAISGTRADQWLDFFLKTKDGERIYKEISKAKILWNIGGNNILQNKMEILKPSLLGLKKLFPFSYNCLVPPIWSRFMQFNQTQIELNHKVNLCNKYIKEIWQTRAIDTYTPFLNPNTNEPFILVHKDLVHFSKYGNSVRIPIILFHLLQSQ